MIEFQIRATLTELQQKLVERLALAIEQNDEFSVAMILARLQHQGLRVVPGIENNETISIMTEQ